MAWEVRGLPSALSPEREVSAECRQEPHYQLGHMVTGGLPLLSYSVSHGSVPPGLFCCLPEFLLQSLLSFSPLPSSLQEIILEFSHREQRSGPHGFISHKN